MFPRRFALAVATVVLAACGDDRSPAMDEALRQDLTLANQALAPQAFMSPLEAGMVPNAYGAVGYAPAGAIPPGYVAIQPSAQAVARPVVRRSSGTSTGARSGSGGTVQKNTRRDAAIGAVAGAAIGAVTTAKRDRMKGAVLGAVAGAVLGGVIGNNVDVTRKP